jgi:two-component system chemotaxis response regulator CheY
VLPSRAVIAPPNDPKHILVVDDDDAIRGVIAETLELEGYCVECAADGLQALAKVKADVPDAIVLDLMMPVMDGWTFLEQCRTQHLCTNTPVLVTSAAPKLEETAAKLRVTARLTKPFDLDDLVGIVGQLLLVEAKPRRYSSNL